MNLIQSLHSSVAANAKAPGVDTMFGVPLTTAEAGEIRRRDGSIENYAGKVKQVLRAKGQKEPDVVMDHDLGGVLRVRADARDKVEVEAALAASGVPDGEVVVQATERTLDELKGYQQTLRSRWGMYRSGEISGRSTVTSTMRAYRLA